MANNLFYKKNIYAVFVFLCAIFPVGASAHTTSIAHVHKAPISAAYNNQIISDAEFRAKNTMSVTQIQAFLVSKGSALASWRETADITIGWNYTVNAKGLSAADIIYASAQWYDINPQVLLSTLEKESSLIGSGTLNHINAAMGYACPETAACNPFYAGFSRQVDGAAYQFYYNFKYSELNDSRRVGVYRKGNTASIDGKTTFIGNSATAALYRYTPHRPDSAQYYDSLGKIVTSHYYGNYNFIYFYRLWFIPYFYDFVSAKNPPKYLMPGQEATAQVVLRNSGSMTWYADSPVQNYPLRLNVLRGGSLMGSSGWLNSSRIMMKTSTVSPGQNGVFDFTVKMPSSPGQYVLSFAPLVENIPYQNGLRDIGMMFIVNNSVGNLYRFYNQGQEIRYYTANESEKNYIIRNWPAWRLEKIEGRVYVNNIGGKIPVYQFYNLNNGTSYYTANWSERTWIVNSFSGVWRLVGVAWFVDEKPNENNKPMYLLWSDRRLDNLLTASLAEKNFLISRYPSSVWRYVGAQFNILK